MDSLIQTVNKLQDVFSVVGEHQIDLPQIVVVGSQSSGKSSVLESLVGKSFLPRGTGIVTRAPLVLQMIRYNSEDRKSMLKITNNKKIKEWATFLHKPGTIFHDFNEVRYEIERRTDFLAGANKAITHESIVLKVYTLLYDLTFVDLPGITKVPIGDQPPDIEYQIQKLILSYVQKPNSIILAVVTANTDPSTSESLKIAREIDPDGVRTIAVVTKLDLIDKGTINDTKELLCGQKIEVKLGIVGVVNRSQKDLNEDKTIEETLKSEKEFLRTNYPEIYKKHGNKMLSRTLQKILIDHIKKTYPILRKDLCDTKDRLENQLKTLQTPESIPAFILDLLNKVCKSYVDTINGNRKDIPDEFIMGGARITQIINTEYVNRLNEIEPLLDLNDEKIGKILQNTAGTKNSSFINEKALTIMIGRQLHNLIDPSLLCVENVRAEMLKVFDNIDVCVLEKLQRFPKINHDVRMVLKKMLDDTLSDIKEFVKSYIETQQSCLNTTNPDFVLELVKSSNEMQEAYITTYMNARRKENDIIFLSDGDNDEEQKRQVFKQMLCGLNDLDETLESSKQVKMHKNITKCYFDFIRKNVRDFVPKHILHKMVNFVLDRFDKQLNENVFLLYMVNGSFDEIVVEEEEVVEERVQAQKLFEAVTKALQTMNELQFI